VNFRLHSRKQAMEESNEAKWMVHNVMKLCQNSLVVETKTLLVGKVLLLTTEETVRLFGNDRDLCKFDHFVHHKDKDNRELASAHDAREYLANAILDLNVEIIYNSSNYSTNNRSHVGDLCDEIPK
jgi:hypothetical protein